MTELEIAGAMQSAGRAVALVVPTRGGLRRPDFHVQLCERAVECECTALLDSDPERMANEVLDHLFFFPRTHPELKRSVSVRFEPSARPPAPPPPARPPAPPVIAAECPPAPALSPAVPALAALLPAAPPLVGPTPPEPASTLARPLAASTL